MFFKYPGPPTKLKKIIYLIASTILGFFLSLIAHALIEMNYINGVLSRGELVKFYGGCALLPIVQAVILILGLLSGYFVGRFWWKKIYIERVWWNKKPIS